MAAPTSTDRGAGAARTGVVGTIVGPWRSSTASSSGRHRGARGLVQTARRLCRRDGGGIFLVIACCRWVDRRWDDWLSGNGSRIGKRLERMRASRLMGIRWVDRARLGPLVRTCSRNGQPDPRPHPCPASIGGEPDRRAPHSPRIRRLCRPVRRDLVVRRLRIRRSDPSHLALNVTDAADAVRFLRVRVGCLL